MFQFQFINRLLQVLGLAMFSHIMQMLFLAYVENPHIERTYVVPRFTTGILLCFLQLWRGI